MKGVRSPRKGGSETTRRANSDHLPRIVNPRHLAKPASVGYYTNMRYFTANRILDRHSFVEGLCLGVDERGRIAHFGPVPEDAEVLDDLGRVALVPGLVNAHSHCFQRAIRGRTEWVDPRHPDDDFWTWRERMYAVAESLSPDDLYAVARWTFLEMALSGITTVGEFHYLHHEAGGRPYGDPNELAHRVINAARDVGIRIALLRVVYRRGGLGRAPSTAQLRFVDHDLDDALAATSALPVDYEDQSDFVTVGLAPHSIRAVDGDSLRVIGEAARQWDMPLHIHACEQQREIEESIAEYDLRPIEVFDELEILDNRLTLVHATHLGKEEFHLLARSRPTVCACPTTERNLGDGFLPASELVGMDVPVCLGSDSQANIDLWEEVRLVEYHERLQSQKRNVLAMLALQTEGSGVPVHAHTAEILWPMLAENGARALRMDVGTFEEGRFADFVAIDLDHPTLVGADDESLLTDLCLTATPGAVRDVFVGGQPIVEDRSHPLLAEARDAFVGVVRRVAN